jgi:hypothetical protein
MQADEEHIKSLPDDELEALREKSIYMATIHGLVLKELDRRKRNKDTKDAHTQNKIKQYAFWTLLVGIAVLMITLAQLCYVYIIQPYFIQKPAHISKTNHKETNSQLPPDTVIKQNDTTK